MTSERNQLGYDTGAEHKNATPREVFSITEAVFVACGGNYFHITILSDK